MGKCESISSYRAVTPTPLSPQLGRAEADDLREGLKNGVKAAPPFTEALLRALTRDKGAPDDPTVGRLVYDAFKRSGLTDRELTVIMGTLLVLEKVEKTPNPNYAKSSKGKLAERGKLGRSSDYRKLTDADVASMINDDDDDDDEGKDAAGQPAEEWFIVDSFGSRGTIYGNKATNDIDSKTLNKFFKAIVDGSNKDQKIWIEELLAKGSGETYTWVKNYATSNLKYQKDLRTAYYTLTELGGKFTGGKYESLLGNKKRATLNDNE